MPNAMNRAAWPFLTAHWKHLVVANYVVDAAAFENRVPVGTALDLFEGKAFVSLVAFRFENARLFGALPALPSPSFEEINLRFYVRRASSGAAQRAVCFVREVVPSRLVAWVARSVYGEPYERRPTASTFIPKDPSDRGAGGRFEYTWGSSFGEHRLVATTDGELRLPARGSLPEFIFEHYWGYTRRPDGSTSEYEVRHPPWRYWEVSRFDADVGLGAFYGPPFQGILERPSSVFVAEGSEISVHASHRLDAGGG
jgi:uncharacterized protein